MAVIRLPAGRRWPEAQLQLAALTALVAAFFALSLAEGPELPLLMLVGVAAGALAVAQPKAGLCLIVLTAVAGDMRLTNENEGEMVQMFQPLLGFGVTPLELLIVLTAAGVALRTMFDETQPGRLGELWLPICVFLLAIGLAIGVGLSRGADLDAMRQETRGFLYIPLMYLIVVNTLRTSRDVTNLLWFFVILANIISVEIILRYFTYVRGNYELEQAPDLAFAHEDAIFCAAAVIILFARIIWSGSFFGEWRSFALLVLPTFALLVMKRRAGIVALDAGLILLCVILLRDNFRLFLITVPLAIVFAGLLLAATWNEPGGKGQFARSFRTITGQETTQRDMQSDEYRAVELANVRLNIADDPVVGLGFGREYAFYIPLVDLSRYWTLYPYVPHNSVMWIWMKAGIIGFLALLGLFAAALMRATQLTMLLKASDAKVAAFSFGAFILMFLMYSWADLGLISSRALILFGIALAGIVAVGYLTKEDTDVGQPVTRGA
jgi:O-antigen ligase